jgi:hypothetical protein
MGASSAQHSFKAAGTEQVIIPMLLFKEKGNGNYHYHIISSIIKI